MWNVRIKFTYQLTITASAVSFFYQKEIFQHFATPPKKVEFKDKKTEAVNQANDDERMCR